MSLNNPLLENFDQAFGATPFNTIKEAHFVPAMIEAIAEAKKAIEAIKKNSNPDFENVIVALEQSGEKVGRIAEVFFNLNSAETNEELQSIAHELSPMLSEYSNDILLDQELFQKVKLVYDARNSLGLNEEQEMLLEKQYRGFVRNGSALSLEKKEELRKIDQELSTHSLKFGENVLQATNDFKMLLEASDLDGLPEDYIVAAKEMARADGHEDKYLVSLQYPSYVPFMKYSARRDLREKLLKAFGQRAVDGNLSNQVHVLSITKLREKRAKLLGFKNHADYVLQERMAQSANRVEDFLKELLEASKIPAAEELEKLKDFAKKLDGLEDFKQWDLNYYSEKLKQELYQIDDELLKPYFKLENCVEGMFTVAEKLYGLKFIAREDIPVYHEDVVVYEVQKEDGSFKALLYTDFFPRAGKRNGAWMTSYRGQQKKSGLDIRPHISIVCNFTKPTSTKPSLLSFQELTTLFHEFGHALHGILANGTYSSLSGTNVYWDFVELPSQIMENWCYEKECLDLFAKHYETGEAIPQEFIDKIRLSSSFMEAYATVRQIGLASLDLAWHAKEIDDIENVSEYENKVLEPTSFFEKSSDRNTSCSFSHIFQGGYSAGYYSYKWAEVLDADAFEYFKEEGIFNKDLAQKFELLLSSGGSKHPSELYKEFRGKDADSKALLRRAGLI